MSHIVDCTPDPDDRHRRVRVTHRFHPLFGREYEFVVHRQNWGEDRVHLHDENGVLSSLPAAWTDVAPVGPFVVLADGRCPFTMADLVALAELIDRRRLCAHQCPRERSAREASGSVE